MKMESYREHTDKVLNWECQENNLDKKFIVLKTSREINLNWLIKRLKGIQMNMELRLNNGDLTPTQSAHIKWELIAEFLIECEKK